MVYWPHVPELIFSKKKMARALADGKRSNKKKMAVTMVLLWFGWARWAA